MKLDLRQQVGQLLIMGFDGTQMTPKLRTMISTLQPGGVVLFRRNIEEAQQTYALVRESQKLMKTPGYLCIDLEGGQQHSLPQCELVHASWVDCGGARPV